MRRIETGVILDIEETQACGLRDGFISDATVMDANRDIAETVDIMSQVHGDFQASDKNDGSVHTIAEIRELEQRIRAADAVQLRLVDTVWRHSDIVGEVEAYLADK